MVAKVPSTPIKERASKSTRGAQTIGPPPRKRATRKRTNAPKNKVVKSPESSESIGSPTPRRVQYRYNPYRRADPTPVPEGDLPADPEDLETLDETAKLVYRRDRELLEYIESIKDRTAAILSYVNQTESKLHSHRGSMERLRQYIHHRARIDDRSRDREFLWGGGIAEPGFNDPLEEGDTMPYAQSFALWMCAEFSFQQASRSGFTPQLNSRPE